MPEDETEEDFKCGTCSLSVFQRKKVLKKEEEEIVENWDEKQPDHIPRVDWRDGKGVMGGWECVVNGDCSFLDNGEERSWLVLFFVSFLVVPFVSSDIVLLVLDPDHSTWVRQTHQFVQNMRFLT